MFFRKFAWASAALLMGVALWAAETEQPVAWQKEVTAAKRLAAEKKVPVIMLFTGSDWCPYCVRLERRVLSTPAFREAVRGKAVLLYLDFPRRESLPPELRQQNNQLAKQYGIEGFPTTVVLGSDGQVRGRIVGAPGNYLEQLKTLLGTPKK